MVRELNDDPLLSRVPDIDGFKVLEPCVLFSSLGRGGMGAVYRGFHLNLELEVAVKCLKTALAEESPEFVVRFQREARVAASVSDANLIRVFDVANRHGLHYLIMEYVEGENLEARVGRKGPLRVEEAVTIAMAAANGLAAAHDRGIVHRDIKPANILVSKRGEVKVGDLGLSRAADAIDSLKTGTQMMMGTPQYMPPEQFESARDVGPSADVYSLASCLWFMLAGRHAIPSGSLTEVMRRVIFEPFPLLESVRGDLPSDLYALIQRSTSRIVAERPRTAKEFLDQVAAIARAFGLTASLRDDAAGSSNSSATLVSPPPAAALSNIRLWIERGAAIPSTIGPKPSPEERHLAPEAPIPAPEGARKKMPVPETAPIAKPQVAPPVSPLKASEDGSPVSRKMRGNLIPSSATTRRVLAMICVALGICGLGYSFFYSGRTNDDDRPRGMSANNPASFVPADGVVFYAGFHRISEIFEFVKTQNDFIRTAAGTESGREFDPILEMTTELSGLAISDVAVMKQLGIADDGIAFVSYENRCEFAAFRTSDARKFREHIERQWNTAASRRVATRTIGGAFIIEQMTIEGNYVDRFAVMQDDLVYLSDTSNTDAVAALLSERSGLLSGDTTFSAAIAELPKDRAATLFVRLPSSGSDDRDDFKYFRDVLWMSGAISIDSDRLDISVQAGLAKGSLLADALTPSGDSLLDRFDPRDTLAAVEVSLDRVKTKAFLRSIAEREMARLDRNSQSELGIDFTSDVVDHLDGRVACVLGNGRAGDLVYDSESDGCRIVAGSSFLPFYPGYRLRDAMMNSRRRSWLDIPATSVVVGLAGSPTDLLSVADRVKTRSDRPGRDLKVTVSEDGDGRLIHVESMHERISMDIDARYKKGALEFNVKGAGVATTSGVLRSTTFGESQESVVRAYFDVPAIAQRCKTLATDPGELAIYEAIEAHMQPISLDLERREDRLVGRIRMAPKDSWAIVGGYAPHLASGAVFLIGAVFFLLTLRKT